QLAEVLQAPVATSVSGKGVISDSHPLAVGWGYGPQGTGTAEKVFKDVDLVLAIGVRYSEVSTAFYAIPRHPCIIQVDANRNSLGRVVKPAVCVASDAGLFMSQMLASADAIRRAPDGKLLGAIRSHRNDDCKRNAQSYAPTCGVDPMNLVLAVRRCTSPDA